MTSKAAAPMVSTTYDAVNYAGYPFQQTHPDRLATLATLFGLSPAPVTSCRVLELGCGEGANLIPMAFGLPESQFVGIDLASTPINKGQTKIAELGLTNIELRCMDIMAADESFGQFDYIVAHGVYSWVPAEVRERMLALCGELLAPQGVAFISYNAYPGYHLRQMAREMMLFHVRGIETPMVRVEQGLALLKLLLMKFPNAEALNSDLYGQVLKEQLERMLEYRHSEQVFHDELSTVNAPFYFHEFMTHAEQHGLQYLAEANYFEMQDYLYPTPIRDFLRQIGPDQVVLKEQYLDFLKCRGFRQTLLCRDDLKIDRQPDPQVLKNFYLQSSARPVSASPDLKAGIVEEFRGQLGAKLQTDQPLAKAALLHLGRVSPRALRWDELVAAVNQRLVEVTTDDSENAGDREAVLAEIIHAAVGAGLVQLHLYQPSLVYEASERPLASRLARFQASRGEVVTNLLHQNVELDDALSRRLVELLDGTRDRAALCDALYCFVEEEGVASLPSSAPGSDAPAIHELLAGKLEENLKKCAQMALLVG